MAEPTKSTARIPILDPNPARRKRVIELMQQFLDDKICVADLKGISKQKLFSYAEAGHVKLVHGRFEEAEIIFRGLLLMDHRNAYFHSVMGTIHQKKNRPVPAIVEFTQALSVNKNDISSYVNRGELYLRHKNYKKAAEDFRNAILLDMSGRNLWANRARSLVIALKRQVELNQAKERAKSQSAVSRPKAR